MLSVVDEVRRLRPAAQHHDFGLTREMDTHDSPPLQPRLPGGTGVAMAARDDSRAVLVGMWTKWSFMGKDEGEPGRRNALKFAFAFS